MRSTKAEKQRKTDDNVPHTILTLYPPEPLFCGVSGRFCGAKRDHNKPDGKQALGLKQEVAKKIKQLFYRMVGNRTEDLMEFQRKNAVRNIFLWTPLPGSFRLGQTDIVPPALGLGCGILDYALQRGLSLHDMAESCGPSEENISRPLASRNCRQRLTLCTKIRFGAPTDAL
jgi:hypothetical protein